MMHRAYILGDTGKAIVLSLVKNDEEIFRKDFPYQQGFDKPSVIEMARSSGEALIKNTEFFSRA